MTKALLAILLSFPPHFTDAGEAPEAREARLTPVAESIAEAVKGHPDAVTIASALLELGRSETHYAAYVLEGRCLDGPVGSQCDPDSRTGKPRARGPWQVWSWCREAWEYPAGSRESLRAEARCAARNWAYARHRCRGAHPAGTWAGAFSGYRAQSCRWQPAAARATRMRSVHARLAALLSEEGEGA